MRLLMAPGMGHCGGGPGVNTFDSIGTLEKWVEKGSFALFGLQFKDFVHPPDPGGAD
jgi:hypothetical protein